MPLFLKAVISVDLSINPKLNELKGKHLSLQQFTSRFLPCIHLFLGGQIRKSIHYVMHVSTN